MTMGAESSSRRNSVGETTLNGTAIEAVRRQFSRMADEKDSYIHKTNFLKSTEMYMEKELQEAVFKTIESFSNHKCKLSLKGFAHFADLMLGTSDTKAECLLLFGLSLDEIVKSVTSSFLKLEKCAAHDSHLLVDFIMKNAPKEEPLTTVSVSKWLLSTASLYAMVERVFEMFILGKNTHYLPELSASTVLSPSVMVVIASYLTDEYRKKWTVLFDSSCHGESFSKLLAAVNSTGACLVIIETTKGHVFGGFSSDGFVCGPKYTGDSRCFLFEYKPKIDIHTATGYNANYAYLNYQQATFPNGLGMGGHDESWSFFLSEEFGKGKCAPNICTFEPCWLAGEDEFTVKKVEVWRTGKGKQRKKYDSEGNEIIEKEMSALDRDPEATAILELSGKCRHSDGYREPPPEECD
ncbi:hypothetical protein AB6A40_001499 [Gnathostoma spinigerum]|uniref:MTOR-associated protein MEAK7 n=1 Tax=Gnathostoma spinigerum TaxID=75299 RepID=A0ABD6EEN2_9BILA